MKIKNLKKKNKKITLSIDIDIYDNFQDYCEQNAIMLSKNIELYIKGYTQRVLGWPCPGEGFRGIRRGWKDADKDMKCDHQSVELRREKGELWKEINKLRIDREETK